MNIIQQAPDGTQTALVAEQPVQTGILVHHGILGGMQVQSGNRLHGFAMRERAKKEICVLSSAIFSSMLFTFLCRALFSPPTFCEEPIFSPVQRFCAPKKRLPGIAPKAAAQVINVLANHGTSVFPPPKAFRTA